MAETVETMVPGNVWKVLVKPGDKVKAGDVLFILEVMKTRPQLFGIGAVDEVHPLRGVSRDGRGRRHVRLCQKPSERYIVQAACLVGQQRVSIAAQLHGNAAETGVVAISFGQFMDNRDHRLLHAFVERVVIHARTSRAIAAAKPRAANDDSPDRGRRRFVRSHGRNSTAGDRADGSPHVTMDAGPLSHRRDERGRTRGQPSTR